MKKISLFLFSLLIIFSLCVSVKADDTEEKTGAYGEGNASGPTGGGSGSISDYTNWIPGWSTGQIVIGIRVSFVTNDGVDLKTTDYILQDANHSSYTMQKMSYYANGHSKAYHANQSYDLPGFTKGGSNLTIGSTSTLTSIFNKHNFRFNLSSFLSADINGKNARYTYNVSLARDWFSIDNHTTSADTYPDDLKALIKDLLGSATSKIDVDNDEELQRLFVVVEPTTAVVFGDKSGLTPGMYYGTAYELAKYSNKGKELYSTNLYGYKALSSFYTLVGRNMPCSSYLTGTLLDTIRSKNVNFRNFDSLYFGKLAANSVCSTTGDRSLDANILTGKNAIGMAIVWFYELLPTLNVPTCDDINEILNVNPKNINCSDTKQFNSLANKFNETAKENEFQEITGEWYRKTCGCKEEIIPGGYNCTPDYQIGTCESKTQIKYSDVGDRGQEYWDKCVFNEGTYSSDLIVHKWSNKSQAYTYYDSTLSNGNQYCPVYCVEDLSTDFKVLSAEINSYLAGRFMTWPTGSALTGSRTCKLNSNLQKDWQNGYQTELYGYNSSAIDGYNLNSENLQKVEALGKIAKQEENCNSCCKSTTKTSCTVTRDSDGCAGIRNSKNVIGGGESSSSYEYEDVYDEDGNYVETLEKWISTTYTYTICTQCGTLYTMASTSFDYNKCTLVDSLNSYKNDAEAGKITCSMVSGSISKTYCDSSLSAAISTAKSNATAGWQSYETNSKAAYALKQKMKTCYTWINNEDNVYNANPILKLKDIDTGYNIPNEYSELISTLDGSKSNYTSDNSACKSQTDYHISCTQNGGCTTTGNEVVKNCSTKEGEESKVTATSTKSFEFSLNSKLYNYITKAENLSSIDIPNGEYITLGFGNIPIAYNKPDGDYNISFEYSMLGHKMASDINSTTMDTILENSINSGDEYGTWECNYNLYSKLITPNLNGLKVIYRPIDLNNPFPDIDGTGRDSGSNWDGYHDIITSHTDIYSNKPMYTFYLTPSTIKRIRSYNKNNSYDDFNLKCVGDTGNGCISDFLTDFIKQNYGENTENDGACEVSNIRNSNNENKFYSCRYQ